MVKGLTRQVVWINGTKESLFDQAFFLVREDILETGGVTEEALLKEAKKLCSTAKEPGFKIGKLIYACCGAGIVGFLWIMTALFI